MSIMIAVDALGGDFAPDVVLRGVVNSVRSHAIGVCVCGPEHDLKSRLNSIDAQWRAYPIRIVDAPDHITMDDDPITSVRTKERSSLVVAVSLVANGTCSAVVSAGNSGAIMVAATLIVGRQDGIDRPAIAGFMPAMHGPVVALDLGANTECKPQHLLQFARLGVEQAERVLGKKKPRIGLLSNGTEASKGSILVKQTHALFKKSNINFVGNIEPYDLVLNMVDVVVCDGFTGNILLKTFEAVVGLCDGMLGSEKKLQRALGLDRWGGAVLVGVKKPVIVAHGSASVGEVERAIVCARDVVVSGQINPQCIQGEKNHGMVEKSN